MNPASAADMFNTAVGDQAGGAVTTGIANTLIGGLAGDSITTGSNNIALGYNVDTGAVDRDFAFVIGNAITATASNQIIIGKASNVIACEFDTDATWTRTSDERLKENIEDSTSLGLSFINDLRTVTYKWKSSQDLDSSDPELAHLYNAEENLMNTDVTMHGLIAQEVKAALDKAGVDTFSGWQQDEYGVQNISREMFVIPLIKAVQELSSKVETLTARIATLED
jgi:hypothetical protein